MGYDPNRKILNDVLEILAAQKTYDGKKRSELKNSDFLFPETQSFPIVSPADVKDAISNYGRMGGKMSYDSFLRKLYNMCKRKGPAFVAALPKATKEKLGLKDKTKATKVQYFPAQMEIGDLVANINVSCVHYGSQGTVEEVEMLPDSMGRIIHYKATNGGKTWKIGDVLKKTENQLSKSDWFFKDQQTLSKKRTPIAMNINTREPGLVIDDQETENMTSEVNPFLNPEEDIEDTNIELVDYTNEFLEMSMASIKAIRHHAHNILEHLDDDIVKENLTEPWLQGMIAITEDNMRTIHDFVMFSVETDDSTEGE